MSQRLAETCHVSARLPQNNRVGPFVANFWLLIFQKQLGFETGVKRCDPADTRRWGRASHVGRLYDFSKLLSKERKQFLLFLRLEILKFGNVGSISFHFHFFQAKIMFFFVKDCWYQTIKNEVLKKKIKKIRASHEALLIEKSKPLKIKFLCIFQMYLNLTSKRFG